MLRFDLLGLLKQRGSIFLTKCTRPSVLLSFLFPHFFNVIIPLTFIPSNFTCFRVFVHAVVWFSVFYLSDIQRDSAEIRPASDGGAKLGRVQRRGELVAAHW